jgi:hypothetical protein
MGERRIVMERTGLKLEVAFAFAKGIAATHRETGCLAYDLIRDANTPTRYRTRNHSVPTGFWYSHYLLTQFAL